MSFDYAPYLERIESEIDAALPSPPAKEHAELSFGPLPSEVQAPHLEALAEPVRSLIRLGGKRWRPLLLVLSAEAELVRKGRDPLGAPETELSFRLAPLVEFVHTASLIHDDIEDRSETRRGKPAAYITYGTDVALNAASWLYFQAAACIQSADCPAQTKLSLYEAYLRETRRLHLGQSMDISWHNDPDAVPTPGQYLAMVKSKTGTLSALAAGTGLLASGASGKRQEEAAEAARQVGAGFQVIDDVMNLTCGNVGKKRGDDIVEGKKSLPVLLFAQEKGGSKALRPLFQQARAEGIESPAVEEAISLLASSGAIERAAEEGSALIREGSRGFSQCLGSPNEAVDKIEALFLSMVPEQYRTEEARG